MTAQITPTGVERHFDVGEMLVSKTDLKGRITYSNELFRSVAGYRNVNLVGQPHSCIRHPDMPRAAFKLLWDMLEDKREVFAYVKNLASNGDHYWVFAHVTPSFDNEGNVVGYHSARRAPKREVLSSVIEPLYKHLLEIEASHRNQKVGMQESYKRLTDILSDKGVTYDKFVLSL